MTLTSIHKPRPHKSIAIKISNLCTKKNYLKKILELFTMKLGSEFLN